MKQYAKYKDSGISWIGNVPEHWIQYPLKRLFVSKKSGAWGADELHDGQDRICLRIADFDMTTLRFKENIEYTIRNYTVDVIEKCSLMKGDILVEKSGGGDKTPVGRAVLYDLNLSQPLFANFMDRLRCPSFVLSKFIVFLWNTMNKKGAVWNYVKQTTGIQNLNISALLGAETVFVPPPEEQKAIAEFLDNKTKQINELVSAKQKQIELLKEYKQAVIAKAVTQGINPKAKMKDSGISWIGQIPEHWDTKRFASFFVENKNINKDFAYKKAFQFKYGTLVPKNEVGNEEEYRETYVKYTILNQNDIVFNGLNLNYDFVSQRVAMCPAKGIITSAYIAVTPRKSVNALFYCWLFKTMDNKKMLHGMGSGIRLTLSFSELKSQMIPVPPPEEQSQIVSYIQEKVSAIDSQISSIEKQIANLNEYKQSLISDVVTGKVKVA